jgi:AAA+ superfamily predicted ATPase
MLDEALFRRFDEVVRYDKPSDTEIRELILNRLARFGFDDAQLSTATALAAGLSHADVCQSCDDAAKDAVLRDSKAVDLDRLIDALARRKKRRSLKQEGRERN